MKASVSSQLLVMIWLFGSAPAFAQPVVESYERFELNWSTMRLRFFGEAAVGTDTDAYDAAEKVAIEDGLQYALNQLTRMRQQEGVESSSEGDNPSSQVAHELTKQAYVVNTTYYGDGRIRVDLEGQMSKAFESAATKDGFRLDEPTAKSSDASALVLEIKDSQGPQLIREIVSPTGEVLYSPRDVARSAYRKNMLGRWFYQSSFELKNFSGKTPLVIEASASEGKLVLSKDSWTSILEQHPRLIQEAKVAFVLPASAKPRTKL